MSKLLKFIKKNIIIFIAIGGWIYFMTLLFNSKGSDGKDKNYSNVWILAKHSVESNLKSPSSAKFPSQDKANISKSNGQYIVKSYVEAENSFGALTKSKFTVILSQDSKNNYNVVSVKIDQ